MTKSVLLQGDHITVAVGFDQHSLGLVNAGASLCKRLNKSLVLIHVIEPWLERSHAQAYGANDPLWNATQAIETSAHDLAQVRLEELCSTLAPGIVCRRKVVSGKRVEALCYESQRMGTALLLVGAGTKGSGGSRSHFGMSTALALLAAAPVPVCVFAPSDHRPLIGDSPRILLADDLGAASQAAAEYTFDLAALLGGGELKHVHINGIAFDALKAALTTAVASSHTPTDGEANAADVFARLTDSLRGKLADRAKGHLGDLKDAEVVYTPLVTTGDVVEQLAAITDSTPQDLLVFGRHKAFHTNPFLIGRVPFKAMLALHRPLLVVPNT